MNKLIEFLKGKKTYLISVFTAVYGLLVVFGVVNFTPEQETAINLLVLALLGSTLRAAI